jgi:hypothetical protein
MTDNLTFQFNLLVTVDPAHVERVLDAAVKTGDHDNPNTLKNALATLLNNADYDAFQYLSEWEASPADGRDVSLMALATAKLAEHDLEPTAFENIWEDPETHETLFPLGRFWAVERGSDGTYWSFGGSIPEELADALDETEVQPGRLVFVTDLLTGRDLEAGVKLTFN